MKNVKFKIIKIKAGCVYTRLLILQQNLTGLHKTFHWAACGQRVGWT